MTKLSKPVVLATSFATGATIMILEILGFRMLAPYFGYSVYVSGSLIGTVMIALAVGYYIGGRIADKTDDPRLVFLAIMLAGAYSVLVLLFHRIVLLDVRPLGVIYGSLVATGLIFCPPMVLLSFVSPYLVKLIASKDSIGTSAGTIFAVQR